MDGGDARVWAHVRPCGSVVQPSAGASTDGSDEGGDARVRVHWTYVQ